MQSWLSGVWRGLVLRQLEGLRSGHLSLTLSGRRYEFGHESSPLKTEVVVHDPRFFRRVALGGGLGAAESLMDGDWSCSDLLTLIRIFIRNDSVSTGLDSGWASLWQAFARWGHWLRRNTLSGARENIQQHYDLSNDFFELFLDETLSYSCALFADPQASLYEASVAKLRQVCRKLQLEPSDQLLEIGAGWGGLAVHAAQQFGCRVTSTTISPAQRSYAEQRAQAAGLSERVRIENLDYRELDGVYDKLVSIEMIEAVGREYLDTYLRQCSRLLRPDGVMVLQGIVIRDQLFQRHRQSVDFIGKYIFPGGFLPSIAAISESLARCTDLRICHLEEMSSHYVQTLLAWRRRFWQQIDAVRELGFDDRFVRMWDYYFQYCAAAFAERQVNVVQFVLGKPNYLGGPANVSERTIPARRETCVETCAENH